MLTTLKTRTNINLALVLLGFSLGVAAGVMEDYAGQIPKPWALILWSGYV